MGRPLWQIFLTLFAAAFTLQRGAMAYMMWLALEPGGGVAAAAYVLQAVAGAAVTAGLFSGRLWVLGALIVLGTTVAATAILESFYLGVRPPVAAVSQVLVAALATGALFLALRHEFGGDGPAPTA